MLTLGAGFLLWIPVHYIVPGLHLPSFTEESKSGHGSCTVPSHTACPHSYHSSSGRTHLLKLIPHSLSSRVQKEHLAHCQTGNDIITLGKQREVEGVRRESWMGL